MKHVSSILVCVHPDNPDPALVDRAVEIAKKNDAAVKVFHVISEYPEDMSEWWNVRRPEKLHERIVSEREAYLQTIVERFKQAGVEQIAHDLRWGKHFLEIIKEARGIKDEEPAKAAKKKKAPKDGKSTKELKKKIIELKEMKKVAREAKNKNPLRRRRL